MKEFFVKYNKYFLAFILFGLLGLVVWGVGRAWTADYFEMKVYACGERVEVRDNFGWWSRVVNTVTRHPDRVRVDEGNSLMLGSIFRLMGGDIAIDKIDVPSYLEDTISLEAEKKCNDMVAKPQVFLLRAENTIIKQAKLDRPATFDVQTAAFGVPDCVVIEHGEVVATTDKLCQSISNLVDNEGYTLDILE